MDREFHPSNAMYIFHCLSFVNQTAIVCNSIKLIYIHAIIMYTYQLSYLFIDNGKYTYSPALTNNQTTFLK